MFILSNNFKDTIVDEISKLEKIASHSEIQIGLLELSYYEYIENPGCSSKDLNVFTGRHSMLLEYMMGTNKELHMGLKYLNGMVSGLEDKLNAS